MRKAIWFMGIFFCVFSVLSGALAAEIKVGTLLSHTGPLKEFGPGIQNGAILAAKQLAAAGFEIELIHEDSETSAIPATNAAKKLVEIDRVVAIIGALASGVTVPVAESVTCPNNVIMISPASTSPLITVLPADKGGRSFHGRNPGAGRLPVGRYGKDGPGSRQLLPDSRPGPAEFIVLNGVHRVPVTHKQGRHDFGHNMLLRVMRFGMSLIDWFIIYFENRIQGLKGSRGQGLF